MSAKRSDLFRKFSAYSIAAGAVAVGTVTTAQGALQVYDYRSAPIPASVEDNYSSWDHDLAVLYMDGTYKYSSHDGVNYNFFDQNGPTTPIVAGDKTDNAVWFEHHDWFDGDGKGFDGVFAHAGNGAMAGQPMAGNEDGNPMYMADPFVVDQDYVDGVADFVSGGAMIYGIGGNGTAPGWRGNQINTFYLGGNFIGFYLDEVDGRHYGWVEVSTGYRPYGVTISGWGYETAAYAAAEVTYTPLVTPMTGDFDADNDVDADDVNALCANMGGDVGTYDMDGDGDVDEDDMTFLVENYLEYDSDGDGIPDGAGTFRGDFNLDGIVNGTDLSIMSGGFGTTTGFAGGNANCDSTVNGTDLSILSSVFGNVATTAVPEPLTITVLSLGAVGMLRRRKA
jgi:hypothetical protein